MDRSEGRSTGDQSGACGGGNGAGDYPGHSAATQRLKLLTHLRDHGHISTLEARALAVMSPAARIFELRGEGHPIVTYRDSHRIARYYLLPAAGGERS